MWLMKRPSAEILARCVTCPSFTTEGLTDVGNFAAITAATYGRFTTVWRQEAMVDLSGCEGHVGNFGGSVLLQRLPQSPSSWKIVRYERGVRSQACLPLRARQQRDVLVCQNHIEWPYSCLEPRSHP